MKMANQKCPFYGKLKGHRDKSAILLSEMSGKRTIVFETESLVVTAEH